MSQINQPFFIRPYHVREEDKAFTDRNEKPVTWVF